MLFLYQGGGKWFVENDSSFNPGKQQLGPVLLTFLSIIQEQFYYRTDPHPFIRFFQVAEWMPDYSWTIEYFRFLKINLLLKFQHS